MVTLCDGSISDPSQQETQDSFAQSLKEVLDSIHAMQAALTAETPNYPLPPESLVSRVLLKNTVLLECL